MSLSNVSFRNSSFSFKSCFLVWKKEQRQASFYINGKEKDAQYSHILALDGVVPFGRDREMVFGFTVVLNCPCVESKEAEIIMKLIRVILIIKRTGKR